MTRIQYAVSQNGEVAALSPDGRHAAIVTWRGNLATDCNDHTLSIIDLEGKKPVRQLVSFCFKGDPLDQGASPITQVSFLSADKIAFLGREAGKHEQVYVVDAATGRWGRITEHPRAVRSYTFDAQQRLKGFAALGPLDFRAADQQLQSDGVFALDRSSFPFAHAKYVAHGILVGLTQWRDAEAPREYFIVDKKPRVIFDSRSSRPPQRPEDEPVSTLEYDWVVRHFSVFAAAPSGTHALLYPYARSDHDIAPQRYKFYGDQNAYMNAVAAPYGLVDLRTGKIDVLIDAPSPQYQPQGGPALWAPDSRSVLIFTLDPSAPELPPAWVEVDIGSKRQTRLDLPNEWSPIAYAKDSISVRSSDGLGVLRCEADGRWGKVEVTSRFPQFSRKWKPAVNGKFALGVVEQLRVPPELIVLNLATGEPRTAISLNPWLERRTLNDVEEIFLSDGKLRYSAGFLVKPPQFDRRKRYPLVFLFDDGTLGKAGPSFFIDAAVQLSGHAVEMTANHDLMVFYAREPSGLRAVSESTGEGPFVTRFVEEVIGELDRNGLIDPRRIGISGWSRAAYYTHFSVIHSKAGFAAASAMDGGAREYNDNGPRRFTDQELDKVSTPLLHEAYGILSLLSWSDMAERLAVIGQPAETLYFDRSPHQTTTPKHRLRSLSTQLDWWRFWLKGEEDPTGLSADQYPRWRAMKAQQCRRTNARHKHWYC